MKSVGSKYLNPKTKNQPLDLDFIDNNKSSINIEPDYLSHFFEIKDKITLSTSKDVDDLLKYGKLYFNQWLSSISREDVIKKDVTELQQMLKTFSEVQLKNKKNEPKEVQ